MENDPIVNRILSFGSNSEPSESLSEKEKESYRLLNEVWCDDDNIVGKQGYPSPNNVISATLDLYSKIYDSAINFKKLVFLNADGGITLFFGIMDDYIDVTINPNLKMDLVHVKGFGVNYDILHEKEQIKIDHKIVIKFLNRI